MGRILGLTLISHKRKCFFLLDNGRHGGERLPGEAELLVLVKHLGAHVAAPEILDVGSKRALFSLMCSPHRF